jgi:hypothetical protein
MPTIDRVSFLSIVGIAYPTKIAINGMGARFKLTSYYSQEPRHFRSAGVLVTSVEFSACYKVFRFTNKADAIKRTTNFRDSRSPL